MICAGNIVYNIYSARSKKLTGGSDELKSLLAKLKWILADSLNVEFLG